MTAGSPVPSPGRAQAEHQLVCAPPEPRLRPPTFGPETPQTTCDRGPKELLGRRLYLLIFIESEIRTEKVFFQTFYLFFFRESARV